MGLTMFWNYGIFWSHAERNLYNAQRRWGWKLEIKDRIDFSVLISGLNQWFINYELIVNFGVLRYFIKNM